MKLVGIFTLDSQSYNYGGLLQEYALQQAINKLGLKSEIIDYKLSTEPHLFSVKKDIRNFKIKNLISKFKRKEITVVEDSVKQKIILRRKQFDDFRKNYMVLSPEYQYSNLAEEATKYDAVVCGSDQIWNPDYCKSSFFLDFVNDKTTKMIYAASITKPNLTKFQLKTYAKYMKILDYISVRENSAKELLQTVSNKKIELVVDPTLLHNKEFWNKHINSKYDTLGDYLYCYFLNYTPEKIAAVEEYAKNNNLKIVIVPYLHGKCDKLEETFAAEKLYDVGPEEFINLINSAKCIITDSFHATVFSIVFNKNFFVFSRQAGSYNMNTRIENLLGYFGLEERLIEPCELNSKYDIINYNISNKIDILKQTSIDYLSNLVK